MNTVRKTYPSDVADDEWDFLLPYLALMRQDAPQRAYSLRALFNAVRYVVKTGVQWRYLPNDFPPWTAVYPQARRWMQAGVFEAVAEDLRIIVRVLEGRSEDPRLYLAGWAASSWTAARCRAHPRSGGRAGYDGYKKKNGSKVHIAVDTLGNLLALKATAASEQERAQVADLARQVQEQTNGAVEIAWVDQGYTGKKPAAAAAAHEIELVVVKREGSEERFRAAAAPLGGRTNLRLAGPVSPPGTRL